MKIPVSVVMITWNEEAGIRQTLAHLTDFDEVVVVDSESQDRTVEYAEAAGARVVSFSWNGQYPKKKQWSLIHGQPRNEWVLLLDADEYPSRELIEEIRELFAHGNPVGVGAYDILLHYRFAGRFLEHGHRVVKRSLLHRTAAEFPVVDDLDAPGIGMIEGHYQPQTDLEVRTLQHPLMHDDRDPVSTWFARHNKYSDWEAYLRRHPDARRNIAAKRTRNGAIFDRIPFKPIAFFAYGYIARRGFLDGRAGLDYHLALAMYYWQIDFKARELEREAREAAERREAPREHAAR